MKKFEFFICENGKYLRVSEIEKLYDNKTCFCVRFRNGEKDEISKKDFFEMQELFTGVLVGACDTTRCPKNKDSR